MTDFPDKKQCSKCGEWKPATADYFYRRRDRNNLRAMCKNCAREQNRRWQKANPETVRAKARRHREKHPQKVRESHRRWCRANPGKAREASRLFQRANPEKHRSYYHRYLSRKRSLPSVFTPEDKARALDYWHGCCAVCGRPLRDLFGEHVAAMDHWIPLSSPDCPGTILTNLIPLCEGIEGCNNRKGSKNPAIWLNEEYGPRKAAQILERIERYFSWVVNNDNG